MTDPLLDPEELPKMMRIYDALCDEAQHYKIRAFARELPYLRPIYEAQGRIGKDEVL
ncbi:hypothetical protein [Cohnella yongneupensis]|uniref:Uncharacterized protein n=1 Tax=Cohnella yongneupensis TaxID=425006 RepID=A0ABW0QVV8_9BACL